MTLTMEHRPALAAEEVSSFVHQFYGLDGTLEPLPAEWDQNFLLDCGDKKFVVKIANRDHPDDVLELQNAALDWLLAMWKSGLTPEVIRSRDGSGIAEVRAGDGTTWRMRVLTWIPGSPLASVGELSNHSLDEIGFTLGQLDRHLEVFEHTGMNRDLAWDFRNAQWISASTSRIKNPGRRAIVEKILLQYRGLIVPLLDDMPQSVIHNDANDENILLAPDSAGIHNVAGLLDFGDMLRSYTVGELAIACAYIILGKNDPLGVVGSLAAGYYRSRKLSDSEIHVLFPLVCIRLCVSVTNSAIAIEEDPDNKHRLISDAAAWEMLEQLQDINWREAEDKLRAACGRVALPKRDDVGDLQGVEVLLEERRQSVGPSLSLAYEQPLEIVKGRGQYLFDSSDRAWLDCVNNVPHVGHCHPDVVTAMSKQAAILNTNTRYLHPLLARFAARLTATLPDPLDVCYFVNSGSEANELALRLARTHTGRRDVIVVEGGYHGNTSALIDLSPYKCEGPGGRGLAAWARKVAVPDRYRGEFRGRGEDVGTAYAEQVGDLCGEMVASEHAPAMFLCESILGCGGQVVLPDGYLSGAFDKVRAVGGLCVVDEVQVGMGRVGTHWWAFETQGVVPDIITVGKPIGNGHPLGAVVTTREIADSFDNGMEYFSTFGGNPVSIAVGMAVMDVIEKEGLRERADRVGKYLRNGFRLLGKKHAAIGDVRGLGMFMGVELVRDRETLEPATEETAVLIERVKGDGILLSAEGPYHNVLKIKPPLQFRETDADLLLGSVDRALELF